MFTLLQTAADSLSVATEIMTTEDAPSLLGCLFLEGGIGGMIFITVLLILLLFSAWKFPKIVKEIGLFALFFALFTTLIAYYQVFQMVLENGEGFSQLVWCGGLRVSLIQPIYGVGVYLLSLLIRVMHKLFKW